MKPKAGRWPDFAVVGAMKSGTTSLHNYLSCHPAVTLPEEKETDFFTTDDWLANPQTTKNYRLKFDPEVSVAGEVSPNYSKYPEVGNAYQRLVSAIPDIKFIYLLREPLSRFVSDLRHFSVWGEVNWDTQYWGTPLSELESIQAYWTSCYATQLKLMYEVLPPERVLVLRTVDLAAQPGETMRRIFEYIGVEPLADETVFAQRHHVSAERKPPSHFGEMLRTLHAHRLPKLLLPNVIYQWLRGQFLRENPDTYLHPELASVLREKFMAEMAELKAMTGVEIPVATLGSVIATTQIGQY